MSAGTPTFYTKALRMSGRTDLAWQHFWTNTLAGALTLWFSDKDDPDEADDDDWSQATDVTPTSPTGGGGGKAGQTIANASHAWYRFKLVVSAGTGQWDHYANQVAARY